MPEVVIAFLQTPCTLDSFSDFCWVAVKKKRLAFWSMSVKIARSGALLFVEAGTASAQMHNVFSMLSTTDACWKVSKKAVYQQASY